METRLLRFFAVLLGFVCIFSAGFAVRKNLKAFGGRFYASTKETLVNGMGGGTNNRERIYLDENDSNISHNLAPKKEVSAVSVLAQEAENSPSDSGQQKIIQQCGFNSTQVPSRQDVILNEVAWMGSESSANDEWIELKNIGSNDFDISGWQLVDKDGQMKVIFGDNAKIKAKGFYLLERTDDASVSSVVADAIYSGALSDMDEALRLFDGECNLIDEAFADIGSSMNWPAGDKTTKKTMERNSDNPGWHTSEKSGGTPSKENSVPIVLPPTAAPVAPPPPPSPLPPPPAPVSPPPAPNPTVHLVINEVQIAGASSTDEFIELYNPTAESIDLTGWSLKRKSSSGTEYSLVSASSFEGKMISSQGYFLLANIQSSENLTAQADVLWPKSYNIAANNTVLLYNASGAVADKVGFGSATDYEGSPVAESPGAQQSIARSNGVDSDNNAADFAVGEPTPQNANNGI